MTRDIQGTYCKDVIALFRIIPIKFNDKFEKNASFRFHCPQECDILYIAFV